MTGNITSILGKPFKTTEPTPAEPIDIQISKAMSAAGITPPDSISIDGNIHRFSTNGKSHNKDGWYIFYPGEIVGGSFGCWKGDIECNFRADIGHTLSPAQELEHARLIQEAKKKKEAERKRKNEVAAATVKNIWDNAEPASPNHPYLTRKGIQTHNARVTGDGRLILPLFDAANQIRSLQYIPAEGKKRFHTGGETSGNFWRISHPEVSSTLYLAEGFATAATVHEQTQSCCFIAYSASNLPKVAKIIRQQYPNHKLIVCADNDKSGTGFKYAQQCECDVIMPTLEGDFNDWPDDILNAEPVQPVAEAPSSNITDDVFSLSSFSMESLPPRDWVYSNLILKGYISALISPGGTGKSVFSIVMALSVALGRSLIPGHEVPKARNVLMINNEDDADELKRRAFACCIHYGIDPVELDGRLFFRSGYRTPLKLAEMGEGRNDVQATPHKAELCGFIKENNIGVVVADPYISVQKIPEKDNDLQDEVMQILRSICAETSVSMLLIAHTNKASSGSHAGNASSMRGATSVKDAVRIAFTLAQMHDTEAEAHGIDWEIGKSLVRLDDAKMNFSARSTNSLWLRLASQQLPNGDWVGVPEFYDIEPHIEAKAADKQTKGGMTGHKWAAEIEKVIGDMPDKDCFAYSDVKERLIQGTGYKKSSVEGFAQLLSQNKEKPTRINVSGSYVEYWITKDTGKKTAPWHVNRAEL